MREDWLEVEIENILTKINGKIITQGWSPQCLKHPSPSNEKWGVLKTTAIQQNEFREYENKELPVDKTVREHLQVQVGDILMTCAGPRNRCGVACVVKKVRPKLLLSGKMYRFQPNEKVVITPFLNHFLQSQEAWRAIDKMKTGGSESGLNLTHSRFKKFPLRIAPLPEQRAIVAKIEELFSSLDHGIAQLETVQAQLKVYRQAVLEKAFEGELTKEWRARQTDLPTAAEIAESIKKEREADFARRMEIWEEKIAEWENNDKAGKKPVKPKSIKYYNKPAKKIDLVIPQNWLFSSVGNISSGVEYGTSAKSENEGKIVVLRMGNMQNGKLDWTKLKYSNDEDEIKKYLLNAGDVLFNRTNSPEWVGKTSIYLGEQPALFAGYLIRVNHIPQLIKSHYLNYFLNSFPAKVYSSFVKTDGVNQSNINGQKLSNYPLPLPSLQEQTQIIQEIESRLSVCDNISETVEVSLKKAESLRQSILKRAFAGELLTAAELARCRAEADWEPAAVLLEKIKGEKDKLKKAK